MKTVLAELVGKNPDEFTPSPLQQAVCDISLDKQFVVFVEDVTGSGKTEASVVLARRAILANLATGAYWGLPTMATANGMYSRLSKMVPFWHGGKASLILAHSAKDDVPYFRKALRDVLGNAVAGNQDSDESGATCLEWLTQGSHRTLLAHSGVGTIDQALFAGLNSYHCGMRWVGLHRKVLIADEVHAADPAMVEILCAVLRHHAALGGSFIGMSATLPMCTRQKLVTAFAQGAGWVTGVTCTNDTAYPLLTMSTGAERVMEIPLPTRTDRIGVRHKIVRIASEGEAVKQVLSWSSQGKCVIWFRNTVSDAVQAYENLVAEGVPCILFHSRFTRARRNEIESEILRRFGPDSDGESRKNRVVVSTQACEQSLDVDFDEEISDLAPVDIVLQRLGRRRRHRRMSNGNRSSDGTDGRGEDNVYLLAPDPENVENPDWLASFSKGIAYVYPDTARLWYTACLLLAPCLIPNRQQHQHQGEIVPHLDARPLVEAVYADMDHLRAVVPDALRHFLDKSWAKGRNEKDNAIAQTFDFSKSYYDGAISIASNFEDSGRMTATRSGDGGVVFLACRRDGQWEWFEPGGMMLSCVPVRFNMRPSFLGIQAMNDIIKNLEVSLESGLLDIEEANKARRELVSLKSDRLPAVLALVSIGEEFSGEAVKHGDGKVVGFLYSDRLGLRNRSLSF